VALYGSEAWTVGKTDQTRMKAFETWSNVWGNLRRIIIINVFIRARLRLRQSPLPSNPYITRIRRRGAIGK
jgi:hypothetical protein